MKIAQVAPLYESVPLGSTGAPNASSPVSRKNSSGVVTM